MNLSQILQRREADIPDATCD